MVLWQRWVLRNKPIREVTDAAASGRGLDLLQAAARLLRSPFDAAPWRPQSASKARAHLAGIDRDVDPATWVESALSTTAALAAERNMTTSCGGQ